MVLWALTTVLLVAIAWAFTGPPPPWVERLEWSDSVFHFGAFFALTALLLVGGSFATRRRPSGGALVGATAVMVLVGAGVEWLQKASPIHEPGLFDVAINGAGAFSGAAIVWVLSGRVRGRRLVAATSSVLFVVVAVAACTGDDLDTATVQDSVAPSAQTQGPTVDSVVEFVRELDRAGVRCSPLTETSNWWRTIPHSDAGACSLRGGSRVSVLIVDNGPRIYKEHFETSFGPTYTLHGRNWIMVVPNSADDGVVARIRNHLHASG